LVGNQSSDILKNIELPVADLGYDALSSQLFRFRVHRAGVLDATARERRKFGWHYTGSNKESPS
jgi:hypothetical protein